MPGFTHQVELKLDANAAGHRLRRIDSWCSDWQIGFRVRDRVPGAETVRIAFEDQRHARAFVEHFGGVHVDTRELQDAIAADAADEDAYDRLAREFPE